jgi:decaprenyl-phosphate phosphoribosyltransferase
MVFALLRAMRPRQWVKNLFVLAPLVFSKSLLDREATLRTFVAFALYCAAASAIYLLNDVADAEADRAHPKKRMRPIASGALSPTVALVASGVLGLSALAGGALVSLPLAATLAGYYALNFAYSAGLKRIPYVDVLCIAAGFELRVAAGAIAAAVPASIYLLFATLFLATFLGLGKRMHELGQVSAETQREVLARYDERVLSRLLVAFGAAPIAVYLAYVLDPDTRAAFGSPLLPATTLFAVVGVARFLRLVKSQRDAEGPTEAMLRDPLFIANFVAWAGAILFMLYVA